ncbi:MAG: hypothetical protein AMXMBFR57_16720 [Acidimicrobiia bacterium]
MLAFRITTTPQVSVPRHEALKTLIERGPLRVEGTAPWLEWQSSDGTTFLLLGTVAAVRRADGTLAPPSHLKLELLLAESPEGVRRLEGRFAVVAVRADGRCEIWTDALGRIDVYRQHVSAGVVLASNLELLPIADTGGRLDQVAVAHALTIYGGRPAKKQTYYDAVTRLGVGESLSVLGAEVTVRSHSPTIPEIADYQPRDLDRYVDLFLEAIRGRAGADLNVVSLSSGWDSTAILATLVHLFGPRRVRAVIGRMTYSDRSGVINRFEISRAQAVADYFGVPLEVVEYDFGACGARYLNESRGVLRAHQLNTVGALGNYRMYGHVASAFSGADTTFFTGETSDGGHNFGFSQFVTMFHPASYDFREYADKMATYLFGPTFLTQLHARSEERDPVWRLLRSSHGTATFDAPAATPAEVNRQILRSMFLSRQRVPFYSIQNVRTLTPAGRERYLSESEALYLQRTDTFGPGNMYGWFLHLYNSFYWQAAPVRAREVMADHHGVRLANPFQDAALLDFLAAMPESWGRGLNLNPTKYPLKWMLANRINYPLHLQTGPHAYTYDVQEGFSISGELLHASGLRPAFMEALREGHFLESLDPALFEVDYLAGLVAAYLGGEELRGDAQGDLFGLATHSAIGLYGRA